MGSRLSLHDELKMLLGTDNCYFQPPESMKLKFPCFVYHRYNLDTKYADNRTYRNMWHYTVTFIHKDPDSDIPEKVMEHFQNCRMDRRYTSDNLYHDVFTLYY